MNKAFNSIPKMIKLAIKSSLAFASGVAVDDRFHAACAHAVDDPIGVVSGVGDERASLRVGNQLLRHVGVMSLSSSQRDVERAALGIDEGMEFGRKTFSRTTQSIALEPPFPPEASWCARTTVPSMIEPTSSTSS